MEEKRADEYTMEEEFLSAQNNFFEIEKSDLDSKDPKLQKKVKQALDSFKLVVSLVNRNSVFSRNEELQDISAKRLKQLFFTFLLS